MQSDKHRTLADMNNGNTRPQLDSNGKLVNPDGSPFKFITLYTSSDEPALEDPKLLNPDTEHYPNPEDMTPETIFVPDPDPPAGFKDMEEYRKIEQNWKPEG